MKQGLKQLPKQTLALTPLLQNQIKLLSLSGIEVRSSLNQIIKDFCKGGKSKEYQLFKGTFRVILLLMWQVDY